MPQQLYSYTLIDPPFGPDGSGSQAVAIIGINDLGEILGTVSRQGTGDQAGTTVSQLFLYYSGQYTPVYLPGAPGTAAMLNDAGQVVGSYQDDIGISHSFVYQDGQYQDVAVPGAFFTLVMHSSSAGKLLGTYFDSSGVHPFIDDNGKYTILCVPGATGTYITAPPGNPTNGPFINNSDQVIGRYTDNTGNHSFLYSNGNYTTLAVPGAQSTSVLQINDTGQVLGTYNDPSGGHSFVYTNGTYSNIAFPGATATVASAINDAGQVAGTYDDSMGQHVFLETEGTYVRVDPPSSNGEPNYAFFAQLNNAGEIFGTYNMPAVNGPWPFLYSGGTLQNISVPGLESTSISGMNNLGDLIGYFNDAVEVHNFLATPVTADTMASDWLSASQPALLDGAGAGMSDTVSAAMPLAHHLG